MKYHNKKKLLACACQIYLFICFFYGMFNPVQADIFLTSENLNTSLKQMQRLLIQLQDDNNQSRGETVYQLGMEADALAMLLTEEVKAHGAENETLINLALDRTAEMNLPIRWYGRLKRFFYNRAAYRQYLQIAPEGKHAADSNFRILEWEFYLAEATGADSLTNAIGNLEDFLKRYPDFEQISEVELYLAIDYRDLWRLYRDAGDVDSAKPQEENTRRQLGHLIAKYAGKEKGDIAGRLLERFNNELETGTLP